MLLLVIKKTYLEYLSVPLAPWLTFRSVSTLETLLMSLFFLPSGNSMTKQSWAWQVSWEASHPQFWCVESRHRGAWASQVCRVQGSHRARQAPRFPELTQGLGHRLERLKRHQAAVYPCRHPGTALMGSPECENKSSSVCVCSPLAHRSTALWETF